MKKNITTAGLLLLLVVFPAVSWYYLTTGIDYRKRLLKETNPMGSIEQFYNCGTEAMKSSTTILNFGDLSAQIRKDLDEQFKVGKGYNIIDANSDCIVTNDSLSNDVKLMLVDTSLRLRSVYPDYNRETIRNLVEHLTLVIPQEKKKELKVKK